MTTVNYCNHMSGVEVRHSTYISTDKQKYKPGETVKIRLIFLNTFTHKPCQKLLNSSKMKIKILSPDGSVAYGGENQFLPTPEQSVSSISWKIPESQVGGQYKIKCEMDNPPDVSFSSQSANVPLKNINFSIDRDTLPDVKIVGKSIEKIKGSGNNIMVRIPLDRKKGKWRFVVRVKNSKGGISFGFAGSKHKNNWVAPKYLLGFANSGWGSQTVTGSLYIVECDLHKDKISCYKDGYLVLNHSKPSSIKGISFFNVHMRYNGEKVEFEEEPGFVSNGERSFDIEAFQPPKFKFDLQFLRKGYGVGDLVKARLRVERAEGGFPDKASCVATARVDGKEIYRGNYKINPKDGICMVSFKLPKEIKEGMGSLSCAVTEGITENTSKSIPIILKKLDCKIFPEGGEILYGFPNGIYFEAKLLTKEPADFHGLLMEQEERKEPKILQLVKTVHEGRGYFKFTPQVGKRYYIKVIKPEGVTVPVEFPLMKKSGFGLSMKKIGSIEFAKQFPICIFSSEKKKCKLGVYKKEKCVYKTAAFELNGQKVLKLNPKTCDGVLRVTLFLFDGNKELPVAERLVFVQRQKELDIEVKAEKEVYTPGETVNMEITTRVKGEKDFCDSVIGVTVVDDAVVKMTEKRKRAPRLIEMVYFEDEVLELTDPQAYAFPLKEKGLEFVEPSTAIDLLLGTQGWRRFIYKIKKENFKKDLKFLFPNVEEEKVFRIMNIPDPSLVNKFPIQSSSFSFGGMGGGGGWGGGLQNRSATKAFSGTYGSDWGSVEKEGKAPKVWKKKGGKKKKKVVIMDKTKGSVQRSANKAFSGSFGGDWSAKKTKSVNKAFVGTVGKDWVKKETKQANKAFTGSFGEDWVPRQPQRQMFQQQQQIQPQYDQQSFGFFGGFHLIQPQVQTISYYREYAHKSISMNVRVEKTRNDFEETIYYAPYISCMKKAKVSFDLNDSITSFCVFIDAFTSSGILGQSRKFMITSKKSFYVEPKIPLEISFKDEVIMPVAIINNLKDNQDCTISLKGTDLLKLKTDKWNGTIKGSDRTVQYFDYNVKSSFVENEKNDIKISAKIEKLNLSDDVTKTITVKPFGFPALYPNSGLLKPKGKASFTFKHPETFIKNSLDTYSYVSPSSLGSFTNAIKSLIREPYGCFEQVSSTMYPMVQTVLFFQETDSDVDTNLLSKIDKHLESGYKKLKAYECKKDRGGFDWYGNDPANESLTAMGLEQFVSLSKVFPVDMNMVQRTKKWLLSRMTDTGFKRNKGRYAYGHAPEITTDCYIMWCLSNSGIAYEKVSKLLAHLEKSIRSERDNLDDNYIVALMSLSLYNFGKKDKAKEFADFIVQHQNGEGSVTKARATITRSGGNNKTLEVTALSCLAFMNFEKKFNENISKAVSYIMKHNQAGRYGSTQSTVLCIKAVLKYFSGSKESDGTVELIVNGASVSKIHVSKNMSKPVEFENFHRNLREDKENVFELVSTLEQQIPYSIVIGCKVSKPQNDMEDLPFTFSTNLINTKLKEGDSTECEVILKNKINDQSLPTIVAVISLPGGLKVRTEKLKELKKMNVYAFYELWGARGIVFYWYGMKEGEEIKFKFDVIAEVPGKYEGDASRAYLYYDDEVRYYVKGLQCEIEKK